MDRVVKCKNDKCEQHFMHTKENTKCPFCHTEYGDEDEKPTSTIEASGAKKDQKEPIKTLKGSFKMWNGRKDN